MTYYKNSYEISSIFFVWVLFDKILFDILNPNFNKESIKIDPDPGHFLKDLLNFLRKQTYQIFIFIYGWTIQKSGNFYNLSFFNSSDLGIKSKKVFFQFLVDILIRGSAYFLRIRILKAKILAAPTDLDPEHCWKFDLFSTCGGNAVLRIRIHWIRKILASWIRISKNMRIQGVRYQPKTAKKNFFITINLLWTFEKKDYKNVLMSEWFIKY